MSDTNPEPRPGDRVRAQTPAVEGVVQSVDRDGEVVLETDDARRIAFDCRCAVEVLERVADPKYRVGNRNARNIYRVDGGEDVHVGVMFDPDDGPRVVEALNRSDTPAAEAEKPVKAFAPRLARLEHRPDYQWRTTPSGRVERTVTGGHTWDISTYKTLDEVLANEVAVEFSGEPRVFTSSGPEPPEDVKALLDVGDATRMPYLLRVDDGWVWSSVLYEVQTDDDKPRPWDHRAVTAISAELKELIP